MTLDHIDNGSESLEFEEELDQAQARAEDWDEETLGLDWNEADAQTLVREVIPMRGWAD
jgi:hypothetical protein